MMSLYWHDEADIRPESWKIFKQFLLFFQAYNRFGLQRDRLRWLENMLVRLSLGIDLSTGEGSRQRFFAL